MDPRTPPSGASPGGSCTRPDLAAKLVFWDDLQAAEQLELEVHAVNCPTCGPGLSLLQRAEAYLERAPTVRSATAAEPCPASEELYDFGRGPGGSPLEPAAHRRIQIHVQACEECRELLRTLETTPPQLQETIPPSYVHQRREDGPRLRLVRVAVAAAAAIVVGTLLWRTLVPGLGTSTGPDGAQAVREPWQFPVQTVLRARQADKLLFPRDRLLAGQDAQGSPAGLFQDMLFEVRPVERAGVYRITLLRHSGDAFAEGEPIDTLHGDSPRIPLPDSLEAELTPGSYTWEAWAVVDGLDRQLGRLDFEVVHDPRTLEALSDYDQRDEPERGINSVLLLDSLDYHTDARSFVRSLPPSRARTAYLSIEQEP